MLLATLSAGPGFPQHAPPDLPQAARIKAEIHGATGKPLEGARLLAYHLSSARLFSSAPSGRKGEVLVPALPYGYYDLAVEAPDGLYVSDRSLNLPPSGEAEVILTLAPFGTSTMSLARKHPGSELEPLGVAALRTKATGREFWRSPRGVAIIAGLAGAALFAIAAGAEPEDEPTPF